MTASQSLHRRMFEIANSRDYAAMRELLHPDYTYTGGDGVEHKGAEAAIAVAQTYTAAFPDVAFEFRHEYSIDGHTSILEITARGTHLGALEDIAPTGRSIELVMCNVIEIQDGKVHRERDYFDSMSLLRQLGVV